MIDAALRVPVSQPPKMARRNIPWVLWELLLRMRLDLLLMLVLCGLALAIKADPQVRDLSIVGGRPECSGDRSPTKRGNGATPCRP
jgi:hypothetical protein